MITVHVRQHSLIVVSVNINEIDIAFKVCKCNIDSNTPTDCLCVVEMKDGFNYSGVKIGLTGDTRSGLA